MSTPPEITLAMVYDSLKAQSVVLKDVQERVTDIELRLAKEDGRKEAHLHVAAVIADKDKELRVTPQTMMWTLLVALVGGMITLLARALFR